MKITFILSTLLTLPFISVAQQQVDSSKTSYHLFNPTPKTLMRDFETDRPDITESAYTVDAGHFQIETDIFKTERTKFDEVENISNYYNFINLKLGLSNQTDLQLVVSPLITNSTKFNSIQTKNSDFGEVSIRIKHNLWGNDGGKTALAVMPFINIPKKNQKLTGGIIFPFALSLPNDWGFGAQVQTDFVEDNLGDNIHFNYLASATLSHQLVKNINFFVESYLSKETELNMIEYFANGGLIYEVSNNFKVDVGFNYGIKSISTKTYFIGLSLRY